VSRNGCPAVKIARRAGTESRRHDDFQRVDYLRSDAKYTIVAWRDGGKPAVAVVRTPLKELLEQLDAEQFAQVHRSVVVSLRAISHVKRHDNETAEIHGKGRDDVLPVNRNYLHLFRQM
jgi:DNA-binding LytR/AlgR family response regulator